MCAAAGVKADDNEEGELWGGGEYHCMAAYPSPPCSMQLGRQNLHLFRLKNTRFDVIGGIFYFCLVVTSMLQFLDKRTASDPQLFCVIQPVLLRCRLVGLYLHSWLMLKLHKMAMWFCHVT